MDWFYFITPLLVVGFFAYRQWRSGPSPYRGRTCTGRAWRKAFPEASKDIIRLYLECFVDGMAFSSKTKLKFHPNDQVLDVYRSIYSGRTPAADAMECETFLENLKSEFGKSIEELLAVWNTEITLGELFAFVTAQQGTPADPKTAARFSVG